jgi:hypothetical protein
MKKKLTVEYNFKNHTATLKCEGCGVLINLQLDSRDTFKSFTASTGHSRNPEADAQIKAFYNEHEFCIGEVN